ncbi:hypothetical protein J2Z32_000486 [Paenibacillus turicensis]|uniref:Uncharacterized protein n=1 Tax=Paenibacillus turicensis TaxID=160487 RepID=A0ABS4FNC0_9BACL|nr:hypothetical protein [Paenibacillus turicensis]
MKKAGARDSLAPAFLCLDFLLESDDLIQAFTQSATRLED